MTAPPPLPFAAAAPGGTGTTAPAGSIAHGHIPGRAAPVPCSPAGEG